MPSVPTPKPVIEGKRKSDVFDVAPRFEYLCCGRRKELQTWFYPDYLVCAVPECQRKIKPRMIAGPRVQE